MQNIQTTTKTPTPAQNKPSNTQDSWSATVQSWPFEPKDTDNNQQISANEVLAITPADITTAAKALAADCLADNTSNKTSILMMGHGLLLAPTGVLSELVPQFGEKAVHYGINIPEAYDRFIERLNNTDLKNASVEDRSAFVMKFEQDFFKAYEESFRVPLRLVEDRWANDPIYNGDNVILNREALRPSDEKIRHENLSRISQQSEQPQVTSDQRQAFWAMMEMMLEARMQGATIFRYGPKNPQNTGSVDTHVEIANLIADYANKKTTRGSIVIVSMPPEQALTTFAPKTFQEQHASQNLSSPVGRVLNTMLPLNVRSYNLISAVPEGRMVSVGGQILNNQETAHFLTHNGTMPMKGWDRTIYTKVVKGPEPEVAEQPNGNKQP